MSCIVFYEKPGCATNRLQKQLLRTTGLQLEVRDLLSEPWTSERLRPFFGNKPVAEWFNTSAPAIKYGELDPETLTANQALELMIKNPLLIRRPLIRYGMHFMAGFDLATLSKQLPCKGKFPSLPEENTLGSCSVGQGSHEGCSPAQGGQ
ncbi:ArsC/Spx/MgsR family protein [Azomonas macrocytogenes]|uniref:Nitrogenase-associated protein n=1 Tax=Azomonas macrocytogenes TaxID=69962 RepID=A0A839T6H4_AZOMA|nr:ArsC/Spx/MgsR family protein [Azomonas macrocytogenes]MBB3103884.1 nitrogenase-associated protein [Azomonas macrocytogenes]